MGKKIDYLWNNWNEKDWNNALGHYFDAVKDSNVELEEELDNLNPETIKKMSVTEFYNFLHDKYFVWKFTAPNRLATTRMSLEKYLVDGNMAELEEIHNLLFKYSPDNTLSLLKTVHRIKGLGVAGASGLLSLLFPKYFGTVDQFVVQRLSEVQNLKEHNQIMAINPKSINEKNGMLLINIMRNKADELNKKFKTTEWTPRKIDKILWSIDR